MLLDGQQRLTTLYMLITGSIPAFYTEDDIQTDPRDLHVNLLSLEFQYYQASRMRDDPYWRQVSECFDTKSDINPIRIAQMKSIGDGDQTMDLAQTLMDNVTKIRHIRDVQIPDQIVPPHANLDEAIDIFDRVNSQGTKLTDAELALTHITGKWPLARRKMKEKIEECEGENFYFGLNFMTRALTTVVTKRALFEMVHDRPRHELEDGWTRLCKVLGYTLTILPEKAFIHSTEDLNTSNALIPLVAYLSINDGRFRNDKAVKHATNWLYSALMWARYTAQTDQRLEADVQLVVRESEPWEALRANIVDQRGRIEVKEADLEGRGAQHPLYKSAFILSKAHSAVDWFNGLPLGRTYGSWYTIHSHHIFPQSLLYRNGWDPDNYTHRQAVNEIANRAFLTAASNLEVAAEAPEAYLPLVEENYPGALAAQFVPMDLELWKLERYADFLAARRALITRKLNEFMSALISEPEVTHRRPITDLIRLGESAVLEFKSTLQWDIKQAKPNQHLRLSVLKTLAAFMNSQGGTLVIGVDDEGSVLGLNYDLGLVGNSCDRFAQLMASLIFDRIGPVFAPFTATRFEEADAKLVYVVDVEHTPEPAFLKTDKGKEFFVRIGNTSRSLDHEETHRYIEAHW